MKPKIALRIAAILMLLHTLGHTIGALTWKQAPNTTIQRVVDGMNNNHFPFMGSSVSLGLFFDGYGFIMIGVLLLLTALLWLLSAEPNHRFILPVGLFLLSMGTIELIYFFPFAAAFSLLAGLSTIYAYFKSPLWKRSN
ncbi:hypothetical protein ACEN9X_20540 [Mucilaginibacter sp. Mucisp86]|uniref:LIC_13387 family protein n=1 Tax=Mucilaginibacter sp. Mucisp86 TaxID=3243060 RepID=UPI0039B56677